MKKIEKCLFVVFICIFLVGCNTEFVDLNEKELIPKEKHRINFINGISFEFEENEEYFSYSNKGIFTVTADGGRFDGSLFEISRKKTPTSKCNVGRG